MENKSILAPPPSRCEGNQTYNEDLTDNGFIADFGAHNEWIYIVMVIRGRGYLGKPPNKPAVGYWDPPYDNGTFHLPGRVVKLRIPENS